MLPVSLPVDHRPAIVINGRSGVLRQVRPLDPGVDYPSKSSPVEEWVVEVPGWRRWSFRSTRPMLGSLVWLRRPGHPVRRGLVTEVLGGGRYRLSIHS